MFGATLVISGRDWLWPAVIFLALALLALGWTYRYAPAGGAIRGVCVFLKLLGLLVLAACLVDPLWSGQRARPGANIFVVIADNSQGMQIKDRSSPPRLRSMNALTWRTSSGLAADTGSGRGSVGDRSRARAWSSR